LTQPEPDGWLLAFNRNAPVIESTFGMHIPRVAAFATLILVAPPFARAQETEGHASAVEYFAHACADGVEHVAVYVPGTLAVTDVTAGSDGGTFLWDRGRLEQLCALPELYIYHCHTSNDVLARFPSGAEAGTSGDFAAAADMEFSCAKAAALYGHRPPSLHHALVTRRSEITNFGFTTPTLRTIREAGADFGRMLGEGLPRARIERAQAEAQHLFSELNADYFARFIRFAVSACPDGAIDRCDGFSVERFAATWSLEDRLFLSAERKPASTVADRLSSPRFSPVDGDSQLTSGITELAPETLDGFVSDGKSIVSICSDTAQELRPCREAKERMIRLAGDCPRARMAFLDQDKYPRARYIYPIAKDRTLLLFRTNPLSGLNERFDLTTMGEPTPQLIGMVLCGKPPFEIPAGFLAQ
jgi:hypothetical protein